MWTRKELKREGRKNLKKNYGAMVLAGVVLLVIAAEGPAGGDSLLTIYDAGAIQQVQEGINIRDGEATAYDGLRGESGDSRLTENMDEATKGAIASVLRGISRGTETIQHTVSTFDNFLLDHDILNGVVSVIAALVSLMYTIFIQNLLKVGGRRFFLENRLYHDTSIWRILYVYKERAVKNVAWIMFLRMVFLALWLFTIVGFFIKYYEYKMLFSILAENPNIGRKEAFDLTKAMTKGYKWKMFLLDLSFIGWMILSICTFQLLSVFFINPYCRATEAELYVKQRAMVKAEKLSYYELLHDEYLVFEPEERRVDIYPTLELPKEKEKTMKWDRHYCFINLVLLFFVICFIGWCWEVFYEFVNHGILVNRGTLHGPWLPIYGTGGVAILILLRKLGKKPPALFLVTMVLCGIIEYTTAWYLETFRHMKYWDYTGYFMNLNGYICLEGLLTFAIAGCFCVYIVAPNMDDIFNKIPLKVRYAMGGMLAAVFCVDVAYSHYYPNTGEGITSRVEDPAEGAGNSRTEDDMTAAVRLRQ